MINLYYGENIFARDCALETKLNEIKKNNKNVDEFRFAIDSSVGFGEVWDKIRSINLFGLHDTVEVIILDNIKNASKKDEKEELHRIFEYCQDKKSTYIFVKENWKNEKIPIYAKPVFKNIKFEKNFFSNLVKKDAVDLIYKELLKEGVDVDKKTISNIYDMERGNLFSIFNESIKAGFLENRNNYEIMKSYYSEVTMLEFSRAVMYRENLSKKMYLFEIISQDPTFYYGAVSYLSKSSDDKDILNKLIRVDIKIKSGLLDPDLALLEFVLN